METVCKLVTGTDRVCQRIVLYPSNRLLHHSIYANRLLKIGQLIAIQERVKL